MYRYWIAEFPAEFDLDLGLIRLTEEFRDAAAQLGGDEHIKLLDISTMWVSLQHTNAHSDHADVITIDLFGFNHDYLFDWNENTLL